MRIGTTLSYSSGFTEVVDELAELEKIGLDIAFVAEAYSFDAVSQLGYLAAKTSTVKLASGIFQLFTRTPTLLAMTAAGLDYVSNGRFVLGIGASGPQVIEGFHGVKYDGPLGRTRETVQICRKVWKRERLEFDGKYFTIPLPPEQGTGLGKPLKLINHPVRENIPVVIAALGPRNVALTAEIADGWQPIFFYPEGAGLVWDGALAAGRARRDPALDALEIYASPTLAISEDVEPYYGHVKSQLALYIGGMGAKGKNFYHNLVTAYGFGKEADVIQELYLAGKKQQAADAVPDELVRNVSLIGPKSLVAERMAAFKEAGVTTLNVAPLAADARGRIKQVETLIELL